MSAGQRERVATLNDRARQAMGLACTVVATIGFRSLPDADQSRVRELIETFDAFDDDNDPHGERDFGVIHQLHDGRWATARAPELGAPCQRIFWKIYYYDGDLCFASDDPGNPAVTRRVLTIMLATEY